MVGRAVGDVIRHMMLDWPRAERSCRMCEGEVYMCISGNAGTVERVMGCHCVRCLLGSRFSFLLLPQVASWSSATVVSECRLGSARRAIYRYLYP